MIDRISETFRRVWHLVNRRRFEDALIREMEAHRAEMGDPRRFGNTLRLREDARDVWGWSWLDDLGRDVGLAVRTLRRSPAFLLTAVLILSLGIGVNLAYFQIINATLLQPLRVKDPDTLVGFYRTTSRFTSNGLPYPMAEFISANNGSLSAVLIKRDGDAAWGNLGDARVTVEFVSANWFDELGASAALGRLLHANLDGQPDSAPVVVLSHQFWSKQLGARPDVVGTTVRVNDRRAVVVGVAANDFPSVSFYNPQVWLPIQQVDYFQPGSQIKTSWSNGIELFGRLGPGVTLAAAESSLRTTISALSQVRPADVSADESLELYRGTEGFQPPAPDKTRRNWTAILAASGLAVLVLLIACLNLSSLTLARSVARVREMSVRAALGAGRWRVIRHLAIESAVLAAIGTVGGLLLGLGIARLTASLAELPGYLDFTPDWRTMAAAFGAAGLATLAVGILPAWKVGRRDLALAIRDGGERASHGLHATRLRHWLVAGQVAGSCLLLVFAAQMARGLQRMLAADFGFNFENVAVLDPSLDSYSISGEAARAYWTDVKGIVSAHPETELAALMLYSPLGTSVETSRYNAAPYLELTVIQVEPSIFALLRIPILAGRDFRPEDRRGTAVVISRTAAFQMYGTLDVVGLGFPEGQSQPTVVGVVGDAHLIKVLSPDAAELYEPIGTNTIASSVLVVRAKSDAARLLAPMRQIARAVDSRVLAQTRLLRTDFERKLEAPRLATGIASLTALLAVALACLGIFGMVAYNAGLRTREIGIRLALGAGRGSIVRVLMRHTLVSGWCGIAVGLAGAWPIGKVFAGDPLYLRPLDVSTYAMAAATFAIAASSAALVPVLRSLRGDPLRALRHE